MLNYLRWFLLPFSWLYGLIILIRNRCYDMGLFKSQSFDIPVISIGNLAVGGAGKSPMAEYLVRLLKPNYKLATLSRGYGRKTTGFLTATTTTAAAQVGDEPAQFKQKFPDITVVVCEKRVIGIDHLKADHDVIILDDAYQHRAVKPGLSLLLFDYNRVFEPHFMLPAGNLREPFAGRKRAGIIIISKCPESLSVEDRQTIITHIKPYLHQQVFFTTISYSALRDMNGDSVTNIIDQDTTVFLITGIANPAPLVKHVKKHAKQVIHHNYPDHHQFSLKNITKLADEFNACTANKKLIVTTEKDIQRLREHELLPTVKQLPVLVMPIQIQFLAGAQNGFNKIIEDYVRKHTANSQLH